MNECVPFFRSHTAQLQAYHCPKDVRCWRKFVTLLGPKTGNGSAFGAMVMVDQEWKKD